MTANSGGPRGRAPAGREGTSDSMRTDARPKQNPRRIGRGPNRRPRPQTRAAACEAALASGHWSGSAGRTRRAGGGLGLDRQQAPALPLLAREFSRAANGLGLLARPLLLWVLVMPATPHLA